MSPSSAGTWATRRTTPTTSPRSSTTRCRQLIDGAHERPARSSRLHRATLDRLADALVERETLDEHELALLFDGLGTWESADELLELPPASGRMAEGVPPLMDEPVLAADGRMAAVPSRLLPRLVRRVSLTMRRAGIARPGVRRTPGLDH